MAFLKEGSNFPPDELSFWFNKYNEYSAWYSGSTERLVEYYSCKTLNPFSEKAIFWARLENEERENAIHMPLASDIASMSAKLLFSESPEFIYDNEVESGENIYDFIEENGFNNLLLEGAEIASAIGGCFLKLDIDLRISRLPILSIITPMQAIPSFLRGRLWECLFFREVKAERNKDIVYRLFENRKNTIDGKDLIIEYRLYKGTSNKIGYVIDLNSIEETESLNLKDTILRNVNSLGAVYIPNMKPNRLQLGSSLGINDFSGCIPLMDSLDLAWTSLVRDIELGMGQIFVDEELMQREEQNIFGTEKTLLNQFSKFQKCFMKLNFSNYKMGGENIKPIEIVQFEMRVEEHLKACEDLTKQIVNQCGYSPSTFGLDIQGRAESGTALRIRERKSFLTREQKSRYWQTQIKSLLIMMQQMSNISLNKFNKIIDVNIELEDSIIVDSSEQSNTIKNLDQARAISTLIKVKMLHPDWNNEQINEEVKRIQDEEGIEKSSDIFNIES